MLSQQARPLAHWAGDTPGDTLGDTLGEGEDCGHPTPGHHCPLPFGYSLEGGRWSQPGHWHSGSGGQRKPMSGTRGEEGGLSLRTPASPIAAEAPVCAPLPQSQPSRPVEGTAGRRTVRGDDGHGRPRPRPAERGGLMTWAGVLGPAHPQGAAFPGPGLQRSLSRDTGATAGRGQPKGGANPPPRGGLRESDG